MDLTEHTFEQDIEIVKFAVKRNKKMRANSTLLKYKVPGGNPGNKPDKVVDYRCKTFQTVVEVCVELGLVVKGTVVLRCREGCLHGVVVFGLCADCGKDLKNLEEEYPEKCVSMLHAIPEVSVSETEAKELGMSDILHQLRQRKLTLVVDLDQTLIHTSTTDNIPQGVPGVFHFYLNNKKFRYSTRLRPGTQRFLQEMSALYEMHVFTMGARDYANTISSVLDPDRKYFSSRILSRDECFDNHSKVPKLQALFPRGDRLVVIIDDRFDMWSNCPNLIRVKPYNFFEDVGDINDPHKRGNHGNSNISSSPDPVAQFKKNKPLTAEQTAFCLRTAQNNVTCVRNIPTTHTGNIDYDQVFHNLKLFLLDGSFELSLLHLEHLTLKLANQSAEHRSRDTLSSNQSAENTVSDSAVANQSTEDNSRDQSPANQSTEDKSRDQSPANQSTTEDKSRDADESMDISDKSESEKSPEKSEKSKKASSNTDKCKSDISSNQSAVHRSHDTLSSNQSAVHRSRDTLSSNQSAVHRSRDCKSLITELVESKERVPALTQFYMDHVENGSERQAERHKLLLSSPLYQVYNGKAETDSDKYLEDLELILKKIHTEFYSKYSDTQDVDALPDTKDILPKLREVLCGCHIVFSGIIPTNYNNPHNHPIWCAALQMGAEVTMTVAKTGTKKTTHLVTARSDTGKVHQALKMGIKIVTEEWLWKCFEKWKSVPTEAFEWKGLTGGKRPKSRSPEPVLVELKAELKNTLGDSVLEAMNNEVDEALANASDYSSPTDSEDSSDAESLESNDLTGPPAAGAVSRKRRRSETDEPLSLDPLFGNKRINEEEDDYLSDGSLEGDIMDELEAEMTEQLNEAASGEWACSDT